MTGMPTGPNTIGTRRTRPLAAKLIDARSRLISAIENRTGSSRAQIVLKGAAPKMAASAKAGRTHARTINPTA